MRDMSEKWYEISRLTNWDGRKSERLEKESMWTTSNIKY